MHSVILYRPVGPKELALIEASGWRRFPPRIVGPIEVIASFGTTAG